MCFDSSDHCAATACFCCASMLSPFRKVFIEEFLKHHGIRGLFGKGVSTNGGVFTEDGRLDVQPYHTNQDVPHGCSLCPPNMCKGETSKTCAAIIKVVRISVRVNLAAAPTASSLRKSGQLLAFLWRLFRKTDRCVSYDQP